MSVERLAKAAGISRATFYIYFSDKGDLLAARFEQVVRRADRGGERLVAAGCRCLGRRPAGRDRRAIVAVYRPHATLIAAAYDEAAYNPAVRELVTRFIESGITGLREHIERGQREGFVDPALLAPETAAWLGWMIERGLRDIVGPAPESEVEALVSAHADVVWHTLYVF